jgi:hypothetical protein
MKGVVETAPDLQVTVGRGQEKDLPYVLAPPPPRGRAFNFPVDTISGKETKRSPKDPQTQDKTPKRHLIRNCTYQKTSRL